MLLRVSQSRSCSYDLLDSLLDDTSIITGTYALAPLYQLLGSRQSDWVIQTQQHMYRQFDLFVAVPGTCSSFSVLPIHGKTWNISTNFFQASGSWCLTSLASHHVLTTSFNWIHTTSTRFTFEILAALRRFSISTIHCSAFKSPSVPKNTDGCDLQKSDTISVLSGFLDCNILSSSIVVVYWVCAIPCTMFLCSAFSSLRLTTCRILNWHHSMMDQIGVNKRISKDRQFKQIGRDRICTILDQLDIKEIRNI